MISVIIPTYNRFDSLYRLLNGLQLQTFKEFEVIVVNDGSIMSQYDILESSVFPFPFIYKKTTNKGRSNARNTGADLARGDLLVFFDDDVIVESDCLANYHLEYLKNGSNFIATGFVKLEGSPDNDFQVFEEEYLRINWDNTFPKTSSFLKAPFLAAGNMAIAKTVFEQVGKFNTDLLICEDYELAVRLAQRSFKIFYTYESVVIHPRLESLKHYINRARQSDLAALQMKNMGLMNEYTPNILKRTIFRLFSYSGILNSAHKNQFMWMPKYIRFKLYDLLITTYTSIYIKKEINV